MDHRAQASDPSTDAGGWLVGADADTLDDAFAQLAGARGRPTEVAEGPETPTAAPSAS